MGMFSKICAVGAVCSVLCIVFGMMLVTILMIMGSDLPPPPKLIWIGLLGVMSFGMLWAAGSVLFGKFPF